MSAALQSAGRRSGNIERVHVAKGARNPRLDPLIGDCARLGIPVRYERRSVIDRLAGSRSHQGIVAIVAAESYQTLDEVLDHAADRCTIVVLDSVQDPRNLGAIIRTADAAGADAVVIPERRAAGLGEAAAKSASGALESVPVVRAKNLGRVLDRLKESDFWVYGFDAEAETDHSTVEYAERTALVMGGESRGIRRKVAERCDFMLRIPLRGSVSSLNVSVAAGVAMYEIDRQRRGGAAIG